MSNNILQLSLRYRDFITDSLEFFNFFPQNLWIQMQPFSLKSWLSRYADVRILFFLNIFFYKEWNQHASYMNWDVIFFVDFLHFSYLLKIGDWKCLKSKHDFHEGRRCFAGEKSSLNSPILLFHLCCKNKRQVFLSVYIYVDCLNNDYSAGDLSCYMITM